MNTTPQASLQSTQNPLMKRCYTMSEPHLSGYRVVIGFERLEDAQDAQEYISNLQSVQEPVKPLCRLRIGVDGKYVEASDGQGGFPVVRQHMSRPPFLSEQDATLLAQAHDMLLELADDQRSKGNDSAAMGSECSADAVLRLGAQASAQPQPVPELGPLARRNVFDAIRGAYDLGYNDARNARAVPGDAAPGYKGRDVEADHGGALLSMLNKRLPLQPQALQNAPYDDLEFPLTGDASNGCGEGPAGETEDHP